MVVLVQSQGLVLHILYALTGVLSAAHAVTKDTWFGLTCVGRCSRQPSNAAGRLAAYYLYEKCLTRTENR